MHRPTRRVFLQRQNSDEGVGREKKGQTGNHIPNSRSRYATRRKAGVSPTAVATRSFLVTRPLTGMAGMLALQGRRIREEPMDQSLLPMYLLYISTRLRKMKCLGRLIAREVCRYPYDKLRTRLSRPYRNETHYQSGKHHISTSLELLE